MFKPLRRMPWRIASAYVLLIMLTFLALTLVLLPVLRVAYLQTLEEGTAGQARLIAMQAETRTDYATLVQEMHAQLGTRITLIDVHGSVIADSIPSEAGLNLIHRPEIVEALSGEQGANARASVATGEDTYFVAVPIGPPSQPRGVARIGVPLPTITAAQAGLAAGIGVATIIAGTIAISLAIVIARRTTQPLLELRTMASRLASGDLDVYVPPPPDEEVAALAHDFNGMAARLRELVQAIEAERGRLTVVLATMADGIIIVDADATMTVLNRAAAQLLVLPIGETLPLASLPIDPLLMPLLTPQQSASQADLGTTVIDDIRLGTGERSIRALVTPLRAANPPQTLVVLQDLTELRRAEATRRTALASVSHDLRTPLTSLQAMIDTLRDGALDDHTAADDFLWRMQAEVESMHLLVNDFLELSRLEAGQLTLHYTPTNIQDLLEALAARMSIQAQQRNVTLSCLFQPKLPQLMVDNARIEQVVLNLLHNALAFTPAGGRVTLEAQRTGKYVTITVHDTGTGISADDLPHIFEHFYRADRARTTRGTGLGLAIVKHLVERHGGQVSATSELHHGTSVSFTLPCQPDVQLRLR